MQAETSDPRFYRLRDAALWDHAEADRLVATDPTIVDARNPIGETALHFLVVEDERRAVEWLLNRGAAADPVNDFGATPLMEAATLGHVEMCRFLLERGANPRTRDTEGNTAIAYAVQSLVLEREQPDPSSAERLRTSAVVELLLGLVPPDESINDYFSRWTAELAIESGSVWGLRLQRLGLAAERWREID